MRFAQSGQIVNPLGDSRHWRTPGRGAVQSSTLFDKVWQLHVIAELDDDVCLLHVDRHLLHDLNGAQALAALRKRGRTVRRPELTIATPDHGVGTEPGRTGAGNAAAVTLLEGLREETRHAGIQLYDIGGGGQGIVHVIGPELGFTQPGCLLVCGDSHSCTHGGLGALAFGVGRSEVIHILATQAIYQKRPKRMRVRFEGTLAPGVGAKDLILHLIGTRGAAGGSGFAVDYAGSAVRNLPVEARLTLCNLSIEFGAKFGMVAPDDNTFEYMAKTPRGPKGAAWDAALRHWRTLPTDDAAVFDRDDVLDVSDLAPQVTWGTSPQDVVAVDGAVPDPSYEADGERRAAMSAALAYMDLAPGTALEGLPVDYAFIGSCTNSRVSDLRAAAEVVRGRKVAPGVQAWIVPGSEHVKEAAEAEGLDVVFRNAGFDWREPGCSMCLAANGETVAPGRRSISTSNRNFVGRQGPGARTHLASPAMTAAAAVAGHITDVRRMLG
jgi:3-isopropylmalate/(R)-2-methylmalate dehydratase large subunit